MSRFHKWYDTLHEPWRFLLAMSFIIPFILLASFWRPTGLVIGLLGLLILIIWRRRYLFGTKV